MAAHSILPANAVENGSFEDGMNGWYKDGYGTRFGACDTASLASLGAEGTATSLQVLNDFYGCQFRQDLDPLATGSELIVLDFSAKILDGMDRGTSLNAIVVPANHLPAGYGENTVTFGFADGQAHLRVYCNNLNGACSSQWVAAAAPVDGDWHHYQIVLSGLTGTGVLLIDGIPVAQATGDPLTVSPPDLVIVGDVACCDSSGGRTPAPDVLWDEIYFGPSI